MHFDVFILQNFILTITDYKAKIVPNDQFLLFQSFILQCPILKHECAPK
jgi:hypothetical protein